MCMCGGIIEVGIITALVGYIGKRLHKCKCDCHEEHLHKCKHCSEQNVLKNKVVKNLEKMKIGEYMIYDINRNKRKQLFYKIIQSILGLIALVGIGFACVGIYNAIHSHHHHDCQLENCTEKH